MVITLDKNKRPLGFTSEKRARQFLERGKAVVYHYYPFVIILKDKDVRKMENLLSYRIKIDPGAIYTGIAIVCNETNEVMLYFQIEHRAAAIVKALITRKGIRNSRRSRKTRYRRCKYKKGNTFKQTSREGWLPPSVKSIGDNIINITKKLCKYINITECSFEAVRFDSQLMDSPNIEGKEYQHGTLYGYEIKEYLMEHYRHTCQYCGGVSGDSVLEWEHMKPISRGGSDSVKNASLACHKCNSDKNNLTLSEWLVKLKCFAPTNEKEKVLLETRINHVSNIIAKGTIYGSNRYSAWSNSNRKYIEKHLFEMFGNVECASGGRTKYNRTMLGLPKEHHYDALSVGTVPTGGYADKTNGYVLRIKATGRGRRLRGTINECGIIINKWYNACKQINGLQTGDIVKAEIHTGKFIGEHMGRVVVRKRGSHDIRSMNGKSITAPQNTSYKVLQHIDGYNYQYIVPKLI